MAFGVVHHDDRLLGVFVGQIALVFRLQVDAPFDRKLEFFVRPLEHLDCLAVIHRHELRADDPLGFRDQPLLDALVEKGEIFLSFVQQRRGGVFQQCFRESRIVREIGERNLRLDHPELSEVAAGVRVLGAEGRPEGVDLGQRQAVRLDIELARD
jgi:hypothetical protein